MSEHGNNSLYALKQSANNGDKTASASVDQLEVQQLPSGNWSSIPSCVGRSTSDQQKPLRKSSMQP